MTIENSYKAVYQYLCGLATNARGQLGFFCYLNVILVISAHIGYSFARSLAQAPSL